jgi:hypothetical protein
MVYRSRFFKHTRARILREEAARAKEKGLLTNAKDVREFLRTHYYSLEELR